MSIRTKKRMQEQKSMKKHYRIIIGLAILYVIYYFFFEPNVIGHDSRYDIYIFLLPTILGLLIFAIYRSQFLLDKFSTNKGFKLWAFMTIFYLTQGLLFSYLSFGQLAKISWDILNNMTAKQNVKEVIDCKITRFWTRRHSSNIEFLFKDNHSKFKVRYETIKDYLDTNPNDYYIQITARKGLWDYYLVEHWDIKRKVLREHFKASCEFEDCKYDDDKEKCQLRKMEDS